MRSILLLILVVFSLESPGQSAKSFLVCGDHQVLLIDYEKSRDSIPEVIWQWDSHHASDLPDDYRLQKFNTLDDCKSINKGRQILVSSSSGAVAVIEKASEKVVFYAAVPNAHSVEVLPGNFLVAAASTARGGNRIMVFDLHRPGNVLFADSLYSAHGLVWNERRKMLYALGHDVLREYKIAKDGALTLQKEWKIPGESGHDLQPTPDGKGLFITEHHGAWRFGFEDGKFTKVSDFPDAENMKSIGQNPEGQYIMTIPEESWWTFHVLFSNPQRKFAFPGMKVYKARWYTSN